MLKKIVYIGISCMMILILNINTSYAFNNYLQIEKEYSKIAAAQSVDSGGGALTESFDVTDLTGTKSNDDDEIEKIGNDIIQILLVIASIISVLVLIVLGIKYMFGSVEEKAEYKKTLMPYVIGATLIFASATIAGIIYDLAINI